tara:strand:+ start:17 stop:307 length:291 start_codon:yes stop_codon:yes gene_type:complete
MNKSEISRRMKDLEKSIGVDGQNKDLLRIYEVMYEQDGWLAKTLVKPRRSHEYLLDEAKKALEKYGSYSAWLNTPKEVPADIQENLDKHYKNGGCN